MTAEVRPSLIAGHLMLYEGRLAESVRLLSGLRERILDRGEDSDLPMVSSSLAWAECWRGNLEAGAAYAEEALECAARIGSHPMHSYALAMGALPPAYAGDSELATAAKYNIDILGPLPEQP